ncbi:MAG: hypothetical protein DMD66_02260 [Gemmatimonadetes bacterium]|nr:MAG: hypothetical protein DMD66_02260 [Gemmatimonadota bacterium]
MTTRPAPAPTPATRPLPSTPYPPHWEHVADLRVFRTTAQEWEKLIGWRTDMLKRGWKLLKIMSEETEVVAIFGRTKTKE